MEGASDNISTNLDATQEIWEEGDRSDIKDV